MSILKSGTPVIISNLTEDVQREKGAEVRVLFSGALETTNYDAGQGIMRPTRLAGTVSMRATLFEQLRTALRASGNQTATVCDEAITVDKGGDVSVNPDRLARVMKISAQQKGMPILFNGGVYRVTASFIPLHLSGIDA
jgi:hypothetical protein